MISRAVVCAIVLLAWVSVVRAQDAPSEMSQSTSDILLNALDADESGKLEISEINAGIVIGVFPDQFSFANPPKEKDLAELATDKRVAKRVQDFFQSHPLKPTYEKAEIHAGRDLGLKLRREPKVSESPGEPRIVLRRNREGVPDAFDAEDATKADLNKNAKKLIEKGALFSYGRDFETSTDQWNTEGILAYVVPSNAKSFGLPALNSWLFFAQWERVDLGGDVERDTLTRGGISPSFKTKESNSLKLGVETRQQINWPQTDLLAGFIVKGTGYLHTDFDFQSAIPTFEFEVIPVSGKLGFLSFQTEWDALYWRITPALHFDVAHVSSDGEWTESKQSTTFAHVGPKILLELIPFPKNPFVKKMPIVFTISILKLAALTEDSFDAHEYTADASIYLRKPTKDRPFDPNVALSIALKRVDDIENKKDDDSLIVGLAVGF